MSYRMVRKVPGYTLGHRNLIGLDFAPIDDAGELVGTNNADGVFIPADRTTVFVSRERARAIDPGTVVAELPEPSPDEEPVEELAVEPVVEPVVEEPAHLEAEPAPEPSDAPTQ